MNFCLSNIFIIKLISSQYLANICLNYVMSIFTPIHKHTLSVFLGCLPTPGFREEDRCAGRRRTLQTTPSSIVQCRACHPDFLPFGSHKCEMKLSNALNDLIQLSEEIKSIMYGSLYSCFYFVLQRAVTVLIKALYGVSPVTKIL